MKRALQCIVLFCNAGPWDVLHLSPYMGAHASSHHFHFHFADVGFVGLQVFGILIEDATLRANLRIRRCWSPIK